jgi:hypothetical protein
LKFEIEFAHENDTVHFAFAIPYSYSDILSDIIKKEEDLLKDSDQLPLSDNLFIENDSLCIFYK